MRNYPLLLLLPFLVVGNALAQDIPLVYEVEHTGADYPKPPLPAFEDLKIERPLPDPFSWSDGSGRSTEFSDWSKRRAEIKAEIEHYGIGEKLPKPDDMTATYENGTLTINMTVNGQTLTMTSRIQLPEGEGPFPAIIGMGGGSGSLPGDIFTSRRIAMVPFQFGQVMAHTQRRGNEPINKLFPDKTQIGAYSAWSWGVSRVIDGLELVKDDLPIDTKRLAVTGCSFAGKMALFAGAFDERIALTIAQESGGGGAAAWRVSETLGEVETLGNTDEAWFLLDMFRFAKAKVPKLPYDHHELCAMVAPRALLLLGNPDYEWLADEAGYVSARAAHEVWKAFGVPDRMGFSIIGGHGHCQLPASQRPEVEAFVDKFLLGEMDADTSVTKHTFDDVNHEQWYDGWAKGESTFPEPDTSNIESVFLEAECGERGEDWQSLVDDGASKTGYVTIKPGMNSSNRAPTGEESTLRLKFSVKRDDKFYLFGRVNCASTADDSFYVKVDDQDYVIANGLRTTGWDWVEMANMDLKAGEHTLTITYREDGAKLDKVGVTTYIYGPTGMGEEAVNSCE